MSKKSESSTNDTTVMEMAKRSLDNSVDTLDDSTLSRLQHARRQALRVAEQQSQRRESSVFSTIMSPRLLPVGAIAIVALSIGLFSITWQQSQPEQHLIISLEDLPLLSSQEDLELYEDLDFYEWLANEEVDQG